MRLYNSGTLPRAFAYLILGGILAIALDYITRPTPVAYCYCTLGGYNAKDRDVPEDCPYHGALVP